MYAETGTLTDYNTGQNNWYTAQGVAKIAKPDGTMVPNPFDLTPEEVDLALAGDSGAVQRLKDSLAKRGKADMFPNIVNYYEPGGGAYNGGGYDATDSARAQANFRQSLLTGKTAAGQQLGPKVEQGLSPEAIDYQLKNGQIIKGTDGNYYYPPDPMAQNGGVFSGNYQQTATQQSGTPLSALSGAPGYQTAQTTAPAPGASSTPAAVNTDTTAGYQKPSAANSYVAPTPPPAYTPPAKTTYDNSQYADLYKKYAENQAAAKSNINVPTSGAAPLAAAPIANTAGLNASKGAGLTSKAPVSTSQDWTTPDVAQYTDPVRPADASTPWDFYNDEGYQFRKTEGLKGVENSAAARGGVLSGNTLKELANFNSGLASQEYGQAFDRYSTNRNFNENRFLNDRSYGRGTFESDRGYNLTAATDQRDYNNQNRQFDLTFNNANRLSDRDYLESQRRWDAGFNTANQQFDLGFNNQNRQWDASFNNANRIDDRNFSYTTQKDARDFDYNAAIDSRNFGYAAGVDSRNFDRSTYENDRNFDYASGIDARDYNRSTYQDDRNFGYSNYLNDKTFNEDQRRYDNTYNYNAATDARNFGEDTRRYNQGFDYSKGIDARNFDYAKGIDARNFDYSKGIDARNFDYSKGIDTRNFNFAQSTDARNFGFQQQNSDRDFAYNAMTGDRAFNEGVRQYDQQFNYMAQNADRIFDAQQLNNLAQMGLNGAMSQSQIAESMAKTMVANFLASGTAEAQAMVGDSNAINAMISNFTNNLQSQGLMNYLLGLNGSAGNP